MSALKELKFDYDAMGNRIAKHVLSATAVWESTTYYVRDAQGNVMSVYDYTEDELPSLIVKEQHIYGSSRLGMLTPKELEMIESEDPVDDGMFCYERGYKQYELSNHLGNVLSVISDQKIVRAVGEIIEFYIPEVISYSDYYPFGSAMAERSWQGDYRYGFNGKEKENEHTSGNYDFGARILDTRLGRWLSVDPLFSKSAMTSPYSYTSNNPITLIDNDGNENVIFLILTDKGKEALLKQGITGEMIVEQTNKYYEDLGLETRMVLATGKPSEFDICNIDQHDAIAVVGADAKDATNFIGTELDPDMAKNILGNNDPNVSDAWLGAQDPAGPNPERAENNNLGSSSDYHAGEIVAVAFDAVAPFMARVGATVTINKDESATDYKKRSTSGTVKFLSYFAIHGAGHTAAQQHSGESNCDFENRCTGGPIMGSGNSLKFSLKDGGSIDDLMIPGENPTFMKAMANRFGTAKSQDNRGNPGSDKLLNCK